jgi:hypothetical protein
MSRHTTQTHMPQRPAPRKPLSAMNLDEQRAWIGTTRTALMRKMQRERAYLDRRAARGTYTPTEEAHEADQILEADLLALLDELARAVREVAP